jgi:hypothetical protein
MDEWYGDEDIARKQTALKHEVANSKGMHPGPYDDGQTCGPMLSLHSGVQCHLVFVDVIALHTAPCFPDSDVCGSAF